MIKQHTVHILGGDFELPALFFLPRRRWVVKVLGVGIVICLIWSPEVRAQVFPGAVAGDKDLYVAVGGVATTLSGAVTAQATTFPVASVANMQPYELLVIDNEIVEECAFSPGTLQITIGKNSCPGADGRGIGGTSAASHVAGAHISDFITGEHHNAQRKEIEAIQVALGANLANIPGTPNGPATPISKGGTGATTQAGALASILGVTPPLPIAGLCFTQGAAAATCIPPGAVGTVLTSTGLTTAPNWGAGGSGGVSSVFGRMGTVAAQPGDYTAALVTNAIDQTQMYANPTWITSLAWTKITGSPMFVINPMISAGDFIVGGTGGAPARLAVPGTGTFCPNWAAAGTVTWVSCPGGGGTSGLSSVGITMPSAFNVTGSPLTSNGVISITGAGNATQYINGLGQLATLPPSSVTSVFGRTGVVTAASGDYTTTQVTEGTNLYYTNTRVYAAITATSPIVFTAATGVISCPTCGTGTGGGVTSVFGRTGAVVASTGDYNASQVANAENVMNKDVNGGYVGRDATGNATIPAVWTGARFTSSDTTHTSVVSMIPGVFGNFPYAVPTGQYSLFLDSSNGNKLTRRDANGANTVIEGAVGNVAGAPYVQSFTSQTSVALAHNMNLTNLTAFNINCFDTTNTLINPSTVTATNANTVTVTFAVASSGSCTITTGGAGGGGGGASFNYTTYTGSAALAFGTYNAVLVTASGASPTLTVATNPVSAGTPIWIGLCNDTTAWTWTIPANFQQISTPIDPSQCVYTAAVWNGTNYQGTGGNSTPLLIQGPERAAPGTPVASFTSIWPDSTRHTWTSYSNGSANSHIMPRCAGTADQCASTDLSDGANLSTLNGNQTITGVKTFSASPVMVAPTLSNVTGSIQCLHVSTSGLITGTGMDCGTGTGGGGGSVSGSATLGTAVIASGACATVVSGTATGVTTSSAIIWTPSTDISGITGYGVAPADGLKIYPYPTANTVNFKVCNATAASITPGAVSLNWTVLPQTTIWSGSQALGTAAIASGACAAVTTIATTGVLTTDTIEFAPNADISGATGYGVASTDGLRIYLYPTAGNVNVKVCNGTAASITPGAVTLNLRVAR